MSQSGSESSNSLTKRLQSLSFESGYSVEAFQFVLELLHGFRVPGNSDNHIDARQLCWSLHDYSITSFGAHAREQLQTWGIESTSDFGKIIYGLISVGLIEQSDQDEIEDFSGVFDFESEFQNLRYPRSEVGRMQWRLSTLFLITTLFAIMSAGGASQGLMGSFGTLFSSWLIIIGASCFFLGVRDRSSGWILSVGVGVLFCMLGIVGFFLMTV